MISRSVRRQVLQRAEATCEYCQLPQALSPMARLQVEHIVPKKHGGSDDENNLALACVHCNSHKGSNLTGLDPDTNEITALFDLRQQPWIDHFVWEEFQILGLTSCGRTTVRVMNMNAHEMVQCRIAAAELGWR